MDAVYEAGIFRFMARSLGRLICGSPETSARIDESVREIRRATPVDASPRQMLAAAGANLLATYLAEVVPWLGSAPPIVAGITLIIIARGTSGFCNWVARQESEAPDLDR